MKEDTTDDDSYKGSVSKEEFNAAVKELKESVDRSILEWLSKKEEKTDDGDDKMGRVSQ